MARSFKKMALDLAQRAMKSVACPKCGTTFTPFAGRELTKFSELQERVPCPKCGHAFAMIAISGSGTAEANANPPGPFAKPVDSRIEMVSDPGEWRFNIPRSKGGWTLLVFAIIWNAFTVPIAAGFFMMRGKSHDGPPVLLVALFPAAGAVLLYWALRLKLATHVLTLSPQVVRLRRLFLLRRNYEVPTHEVGSVRKTVFYTQNHKPVFGIEITAGNRRIRFGSQLTDGEKNWIAWQIRDFARSRGAPLPAESGAR